jgi:DNA polymerase-2
MTHILEGDPAEQLETLNRRIQQWDPDVLTTDWGDGYLIPHLLEWARRARRPLRLNRDRDFEVAARPGKSFMSYGRTVHQSGAHYLFGRWHLDLKNSFYFKECGWEGLFEIARIAKIPVQRAARTTIGTSLSSMQLDVALKRGLLIPLDKAQAEDFRPGVGSGGGRQGRVGV